jgi:arylsulfatase A-like enzyme
VGALLRGEPLDEIPVYAERWNARAPRWGKWKLIWHTSKDDICPHSVLKTCRKGHHWFELYDIEADPHERTDLSTAQPDKLKEMKAKVEEIIDGLYKKSGGIGPNP